MTLRISGLPPEEMRQAILWWLENDGDGERAIEDVARAHDLVRQKRKKSIVDYQALALWGLARQYDEPGARILEIGTYYGFSAAVLAMAAPRATVHTLNPVPWEAAAADKNLFEVDNAVVWKEASWDFLAREDPGAEYALIFFDGDHNAVARDVPWFNRLRDGGLALFHDYTPGTSFVHPCEPVFRAVTDLGLQLGREPDVLLVEESTFGMAGFYRREGEQI